MEQVNTICGARFGVREEALRIDGRQGKIQKHWGKPAPLELEDLSKRMEDG